MNWNKHEKEVVKALASRKKNDWNKLWQEHEIKTARLQNERLIHLLVTLFFGLFGLLCLFAFLFLNRFEILILAVLFLTTDFFYILHYYRLENTVQRWYGLADELANRKK